jgi:MFS family permease
MVRGAGDGPACGGGGADVGLLASCDVRRDLARIAIYAGGFLGPLGGGVVVVLIPDLRHELGTTTAGAAATLTAYLVPFALLQLVSGTLGERLGLARTIRTAYVVYAVVSVGVALASSLAPFLALRALQGAANAFTTPLLVAALADLTPQARLGRAMGTFAAVQTAAVVFAPLVGGAAGTVDYRLAFLAPAAVALLLAAAPLPAREPAAGAAPTLRAALSRRTLQLSVFAFFGYMSTLGIAVLVALRAADRFGVGAGHRGLLLAGFGVAGVLAGRAIGGLVDRLGPLRVLSVGSVACALLLPLSGVAGTVGLLVVTWSATGLASQMLWGTVYTLAVDAAPANRAGGVSIVGACRFAGNAAAPLVWLPLYHWHAWLPFAAAGAVMLALGLLSARSWPGVRRAPEPSTTLEGV